MEKTDPLTESKKSITLSPRKSILQASQLIRNQVNISNSEEEIYDPDVIPPNFDFAAQHQQCLKVGKPQAISPTYCKC